VVAVEKTRRRTQGQRNQHKLTAARIAVSDERPHSHDQTVCHEALKLSSGTKIALATARLSHWDVNANNKPLEQQRSLETANLSIAYRWRRKTTTQPRNTRHSLAGSVSEIRKSEASIGDIRSFSSPPSCCFCSCPYWACSH
jgi:hypothetical protein